MAHAAPSSAAEVVPSAHGTSTPIENKKLIMWLFLASDCMFFGTLISTHLIYRKLYPDVINVPKLFDIELTTFSTFVLLLSSLFMFFAVSAMHKGSIKEYRRMVSLVIVGGLIFLGCQVYEFAHFVEAKHLTLTSNLFGSTFYVLTGTHGTHVAIGVLWLTAQLFWSYTPKFTTANAIDVETAGLYWHFVDIVWLIIFPAVYLVEFIKW